MERDSTGTLYVTTKQIYFDGDMQDRKIQLKKLSTLKYDDSAVEISCENRQKSMVFMNVNGHIIDDIIHFIRDNDE